MIKVTVYMPAFNCARYIEKGVTSVIGQTFGDWEFIIINDGSTDNTQEVLRQFLGHPKITMLDQENKGLTVTNNIALRLSRGKYVMRLDADDYLDENALLILSNILDSKPDVGLVYPDYYEIDTEGEIINLVRRKKIPQEVELLDLPAHGACTMFRRECLLQLGGYDEEFSCQDGYEMWLRFISKFTPYNVNIPLFYYRRHPASLTNNAENILKTRGQIKRRFVRNNGHIPKVMGLIPVVRHSVYHYNDPFQQLAGKPLLWYSLDETIKSKLLDRIVVACDDNEVLRYAEAFPKITPLERPANLSRSNVRMENIVSFALHKMKEIYNYEPEAVCTLYISTPLRRGIHIDKAIDTMTIFDVDSVISVEEELAFCYHHGRLGLEPIHRSREIRSERKAIYKENGAIYLTKTELLKMGKLVGGKTGNISMLPQESIRVNSMFDLWFAEKVLQEWKK